MLCLTRLAGEFALPVVSLQLMLHVVAFPDDFGRDHIVLAVCLLPSSGVVCGSLHRFPNDLVDDVPERCRGVDDDAVLRNVFLCLMQSHSKVPFGLLSTPLIVRTFL